MNDNPINLGDNVAAFHGMHVSNPPHEMPEHMAAYCLAITRLVFEATGGFNEKIFMAEDWDLGNRLRAAGHRIYFDPSVRITHHSTRETEDSLRQHARSYAVGYTNMLEQNSEFGGRWRLDWLGKFGGLADIWCRWKGKRIAAKIFRKPAMQPFSHCRKYVTIFHTERRRHIMRLLKGRDLTNGARPS